MVSFPTSTCEPFATRWCPHTHTHIRSFLLVPKAASAETAGKENKRKKKKRRGEEEEDDDDGRKDEQEQEQEQPPMRRLCSYGRVVLCVSLPSLVLRTPPSLSLVLPAVSATSLSASSCSEVTLSRS